MNIIITIYIAVPGMCLQYCSYSDVISFQVISVPMCTVQVIVSLGLATLFFLHCPDLKRLIDFRLFKTLLNKILNIRKDLKVL